MAVCLLPVWVLPGGPTGAPMDPLPPGRAPSARVAPVAPVVTAAATTSTASAPLRFPLAGDHRLTDSFGDPRSRGRRHQGVDIMAAKRTPVFAVADGVVEWTHDRKTGRCCAVALLHDDGSRSRYIHLDNDTPGTDDGLAEGIAAGVTPGARLRAGDLVGWVGDSGNAERVAPHLHFEWIGADGVPSDPYPLLLALAPAEVAPGGGAPSPAAAVAASDPSPPQAVVVDAPEAPADETSPAGAGS